MSAPSPAALRVLLLDDDAFMLELLTDMIGEHGPHEVRRASDGRRALAALRAEPPDLLICDLGMPDLDGIEFLRLAAEQRYAGNVVLLSGMDAGLLEAAERLAQAYGLAVLAACAKPLRQNTLQQLLASAAPNPAATAR